MRVQVRTELDTKLAPESLREAILDFTPRRLELWRYLDPEAFAVHRIDETTALVTEGCVQPEVWSVELYDWSDPDRITWTTQESDFCSPGSRMTLEMVKQHDGGSHLTVIWDRSPSNWRSRSLLFGAVVGGRRTLNLGIRQNLDSIAEVLER